MSSPFHEGERAVQERALRALGVPRDRVESLGRRIIRDAIPPSARELFARLPWLQVGTLDETGQPWASVLVGEPGFISTPDEKTLRVEASALSGDRLSERLQPGAPVGLLGLEPATRRRNRANGHVLAADERGFTMRVAESFGNCPKYIQARTLGLAPARTSTAVALGPSLSASARALLEASDTLFLATVHGGTGPHGVDISHRGGRPGFARVDVDATTGVVRVVMPDFTGNFMFQSLGNLATEPRAGLLALDFTTGDVVSVTAEARVEWEGADLEAFEGAERVLRLRVTGGLWLPGASRLRGSAAEEAPELAELGSWR